MMKSKPAYTAGRRLMAGVLLLLSLASQAPAAGRMALILDDIGNNRARGERAAALPGPITLSVLPGLPHSRMLAEAAHTAGHAVMLHMPMENHRHLALGPKGLRVAMSAPEIRAVLTSALADVPHAVGLNNHMGSLFTERPEALAPVMSVLRERRLFFLDSLTSPDSQALSVARAAQVPALARQVFLDHERTEAFISQQLALALRIMDEYGEVIVIGHPYPETLDFLEWALPMMQGADIELVPPSALLDAGTLPQTAEHATSSDSVHGTVH